MTIRDDIAAIRADSNNYDPVLDEAGSPILDGQGNPLRRLKRSPQIAIYQLKVAAWRDVIVNGKPAPQPVPPLLGRAYTVDGLTIEVKVCSVGSRLANDGETLPYLYLDIVFTRAPLQPVQHQYKIQDPPPLPKNPTGSEKQDLIQAAMEFLPTLPGVP
jgi:hypothetical protein